MIIGRTGPQKTDIEAFVKDIPNPVAICLMAHLHTVKKTSGEMEQEFRAFNRAYNMIIRGRNEVHLIPTRIEPSPAMKAKCQDHLLGEQHYWKNFSNGLNLAQ